MKYDLKRVSPQDIDYNPSNPRGETEADIQNDDTFEQLKDSVYQFGVLVPVVVHEQPGGPKPYRLVDGERRVRAALLTGIKRIPAHVAVKKDDLSDLVQAFHIHMLRKQWRAVAQARAFKLMLEQLRHKQPNASEEQLFEELQDQTSCSDTRFKALRRAIRFPNSVLDEVESGKLGWSHLIQIEESFMEPVSTQYPELLKQVGKDKARRVLVTKARRKVLTRTRTLMDTVSSVIARAQSPEERKCVEGLLGDFLQNEEMSGEDVLKKYEQKFPESGQDIVETGNLLLERVDELQVMLARIEVGRLAGYPELAKKIADAMTNLKSVLGRMLRKFGNRMR